jgi:hypothetical protein
MSDALWWYAERDETKGPVSFEELVQALKRHAQADDVLVWTEGYKNWLRAGDVQVLNRLLVRPPPLPNRKATVSPLSPEYRQLPTPEGTKLGWKRLTATVGGAAVGVGLSKIMGSAFWIPALCMLAAHWGFKKTTASSPVVLMLSVLVGHTLWMAIGHFSLLLTNKPSPDLGVFFIDLIAVLVLTAWCLRRKSVISCFAVLVYQCLALVSALMDFEQTVRVSEIAALVHVFLRVLGIGFAGYAAVKTRKEREMEFETLRSNTQSGQSASQEL